MKQFFFFCSILLVSFSSRCEHSFYGQLCAFNFNWELYADRVSYRPVQTFHSDREYIQAHLGAVLPILRSNPTSFLSSAQRQTRERLIEVLAHYREAGVFPVNYYRQERIPVFIDEHNTHCAVGFLMQQSGFEWLARRIAGTQNYAWVKDISDPALPAWQHFSGFTVDELKLIQGAYDSYIERAFLLPNKYEIPQKPEVVCRLFNEKLGKDAANNVWCLGEGNGQVLHGKWIQNYSKHLPWIKGFYDRGKRTGQWEEYYQGTNDLCRTEVWRNDKLNGLRRRFDQWGKLIEEILFKDGKAISKTNFDLDQGLTFIRKPIDSLTVFTEVYTSGGMLLASGRERISNPGNLQWFQNIQLTALNSFAISAQRGVDNGNKLMNPGATAYQYTPLVRYIKEGKWVYYAENAMAAINADNLALSLSRNLPHLHRDFSSVLTLAESQSTVGIIDSVVIDYTGDKPELLRFFGSLRHARLKVLYQLQQQIAFNPNGYYLDPYAYDHPMFYDQTGVTLVPQISAVGPVTANDESCGIWKHYNEQGKFYKREEFIIPRKEHEQSVK